MSTVIETPDEQMLELLAEGPLGVAELMAAMSVTATAVRQRLQRLMRQGLIERTTTHSGRGRPSHRYSLTDKARRRRGNNFADLATTLWDEIRAVKDDEVRRGLLQRIATKLAARYEGQVQGDTLEARMEEVKALFADRHVSMEVDANGPLPVLTAKQCPYPELAEKDRGICAVESMMFSALLDERVRLARCRLDGHACCEFQTS